MLHRSKLPVRGPVHPSVNKPPRNEMDPEKYNERANEAISEGNSSQSNNEGNRLNYDRFAQEVDRRWTIDPNKPEPISLAALNHPTLSPLIGYNWANPADAEKTTMDSDNNTEAIDTPSSDQPAGPSTHHSSGNHTTSSRPTYPDVSVPFFLADDSPSEYDSEEQSHIYRHSVTHLPNQTYLPKSYLSSQHQDQQRQQRPPPSQARQQQQQRIPYRLPPIPHLLPATTFSPTLQSSHTPASPHNNSQTRDLLTAPPPFPLPPTSSQQPSSFIPLHLSIHTPLDPQSLSSNATYQLTPTKTFNLLHECNTLKKVEGVVSRHFANELRNLGFGGAVRVLGWRALVPPKTDGKEDGKGDGVGVGKKVGKGKGKRVLRKREGNHEEGETPGVWWNVVSEAGWGEWVGRVQESAAAAAADIAAPGADGLGAVEGGVIEGEGEGERAEGGAYPPEQGGEEFVVEAKAVVMMVVSKEARVKEPKKLATVGQVQHGQDRGGDYGAAQTGEGRGMKRRRLSMHGDYAGPDGYSHGYGELDNNGAWEEAIDDKDDGGEDVEAKEEQVSTIMIYRHEYDELVREGREVRGLKAEVERLGKEIARLSMSLR